MSAIVQSTRVVTVNAPAKVVAETMWTRWVIDSLIFSQVILQLNIMPNSKISLLLDLFTMRSFDSCKIKMSKNTRCFVKQISYILTSSCKIEDTRNGEVRKGMTEDEVVV